MRTFCIVFILLFIPSLCSAKKHEVLLSCENVEAIELHRIRGALWINVDGAVEGYSFLVFYRLPVGTIPKAMHESAEKNRMGEQGVWKDIRLMTPSGEALLSDAPKWNTIGPQHVILTYKSAARARKAARMVCKEKTPDEIMTDES